MSDGTVPRQTNNQSGNILTPGNIYSDVDIGRGTGRTQLVGQGAQQRQSNPDAIPALDLKKGLEHVPDADEQQATDRFRDDYHWATAKERNIAVQLAMAGPSPESSGFPNYVDAGKKANANTELNENLNEEIRSGVEPTHNLSSLEPLKKVRSNRKVSKRAKRR
jgi:hypothetical protein